MTGERIRREDVDARLISQLFGGPLDGRRTADFPRQIAGRPLTGVVLKSPLSQPARFSLYAVYCCTSQTQVDGYWRFEFQGVEGPNGEQLVSALPTPSDEAPGAAELRQRAEPKLRQNHDTTNWKDDGCA